MTTEQKPESLDPSLGAIESIRQLLSKNVDNVSESVKKTNRMLEESEVRALKLISECLIATAEFRTKRLGKAAGAATTEELLERIRANPLVRKMMGVDDATE